MYSMTIDLFRETIMRHLKVRINEHVRKKKEPIRKHSDLCKESVAQDNIKILCKNHRCNCYLMTTRIIHLKGEAKYEHKG